MCITDPLFSIMDIKFMINNDLICISGQVTMMGKLRQYNNEIIVGHNVGPHEYNASTYAIKVSQ